MGNKGSILFIVPYPLGKAPSQRFRFEQYLSKLVDIGWSIKIFPFLNEYTWSILYKQGYYFQKAAGILLGFLKRMVLLVKVSKYDFVFIHREAAPIGPPFIEWFISKILKKKVIYDFDDAIWLANTSENNKIVAGLKWHHKVESICKWAYKVSCGNAYLHDYATQFNSKTFLIPTTIDTQEMHNPNLFQKPKKNIPVIGWTGTHSTLPYLEPIVPILQKLEQHYQFEFCVIANFNPQLPLKSFKFVLWQKETEMEDLIKFDIGLMPLTDDKWAKGKCGFKALQYMALGVPALVSPVGVNTAIVKDGIDGFICTEPNQWELALIDLLHNVEKRIIMGNAARENVISNYSILSNTDKFLSLFDV